MKKKNIVQRLSWIVLPFLYMGIIQHEVFGYDLLIRKHVLLGSVCVEIKDGIDLSRQDLTNARINLGLTELRNIDFSRADLTNADLRETKFRNCSFRGANLTGVNAYDSHFVDCDFEGATISGAKNLCITQEQLCSTACYKARSLKGVEIQMPSFSGLDFSRFYLMSTYLNGDITGCDFTNTAISCGYPAFSSSPRGATLWGISKEQLISTSSFKSKRLIYVKFGGSRTEDDFPGLDLSGFNLTGTYFARNLKDVNLTDTVITDCDFRLATNLTLDQIKSTWDYKTGNMAGVQLPPKLQEQLDAERQVKEESP